MKKFIYGRSINLAFFFVILASCSLPTDQEIVPLENVIEVTNTLAPLPTQILPADTPLPAPTNTPIPLATETSLPPTDTSTPIATETPLPPTDTPMPTDSPTPPPSPPPAIQTTNLQVDVTKLSDYKFEVRPFTNLTLRDISNDGKMNMCRITKTGFSRSITIPVNLPSEKFQLPSGDYLLSCEVPNKVAKIVSK